MIVLDASAAVELLVVSAKGIEVAAHVDRARSILAPHLLDIEVTQVLRTLEASVTWTSGFAFVCSNVTFDAEVELAVNKTPELATQYVFDRFGRRTTGLAMLNPGYDLFAADLKTPPITRDMPGTLVDLVFSRKLFTVFLVNGCDAMNGEHSVLSNVVNAL